MALNKKARTFVEIILILGIFYGVRIVMIQAKVLFVYIPYVDDSIKMLVKVINDPTMQQDIKYAIQRFYHRYF